MTSWTDFEREAPELAARARALFDAHGHKVLATLRADGSPRVSGTEMPIRAGEALLGSMLGARKVDDLRRDPRCAVHSASEDPDVWTADAKLSGRAVPIAAEEMAPFVDAEVPEGSFELFRIDLTEVVVTGKGDPADHLVIERWTPAGGVTRVERR